MQFLFYVYKIANLLNGNFYIGVHKTSNLEDGYMGSGKRICAAIKKHGIENFSKDILFMCSSEEEMYMKEKELVTLELVNCKECYNIVTGGYGGWNHVDQKEARKNTNKVLLEKYGEDYQSILGKMGAKVCKEKQVGIFNPSFNNPFKNRDIQQLGNTPEARAKASITVKKTFNEIKHQQGEKNSQFGSCWITKEGQNKKIKKDALDQWLNDGWSKGRKL